MIRIKGWAKFQHFKDRKPPWIKLYRDILDDKEWHRLDAKAAKALVMLWLIASENDGALPDRETLAFRLRTTETEVDTAISKLSHWLDHDDIGPISACYQDDAPETEAETEAETEERQRESAASAPPAPAPAPKQKRKSPTTPLPEGFGISERVRKWAAAKGHVNLDAHLESFLGKVRAKDYRYVDWDEAFMTAVRDDWAKLRGLRVVSQPSPDEAAAVGQRAAEMTRQLLEQQASVTQSPEAVKAGVEALKALQQRRLTA